MNLRKQAITSLGELRGKRDDALPLAEKISHRLPQILGLGIT